MTDKYNAGELEIVARLNMQEIHSEFKALKREIATEAENSGVLFVQKARLGLKSNQIGTIFQKDLASRMTKSAEKLGDEFAKGYRVSVSRGLKKTASSIKKIGLGGIGKGLGKSLLKGGVVGIGLEALNLGLRGLLSVGGSLKESFSRWKWPDYHSAKEAAEQLAASKERLNSVLEQSDKFLSKYAKQVDPARKALEDYRKASEKLKSTLDSSNGGPELGAGVDASGMENYLNGLDNAKTGQDGLNASVDKFVAAQKLAFEAEAFGEYENVLGELIEQQKLLAELEKDPKRQGDAIKEAEANVAELNSRLNQTRDTYKEIRDTPDSEIRAEIDKEINALKNRNEIMLAQAAGDEKRVKELQDQALEQQKLNEFMRAYKGDQDDAAAAAAEFMENLRAARKTEEERKAAEAYRLTLAKRHTSELNDQLAIAQANGDNIAVQALEDQLLLEQKIAEYKDAKFANYEARAKDYLAKMQAARVEAQKLAREELEIASQLEIAAAGGDENRVKELQDQQKEVELTAKYEAVGYDPLEANELAQAQMAQVEAALAQKRAKEEALALEQQLLALAERDLQIELERAKFDKNDKRIAEIEREFALRAKIQELTELGLSETDARQRAERELALYDLEKEIEARIRKNDQLLAERQSQLELAKLRADSTEIADLEKQIELLQKKRKYLKEGQTDAQATSSAQDDIEDINDAENIGKVKDLFKSGIKAAIEGDFEEFLADKLESAADSMFDSALDSLLDGLLSAEGPLAGLFGKDGPLSGLFGGEGGDGGLAGLFAGFFADGGVVPKGQFAIVGERGPEVISAGASPLRVTPINDNYAATATAGKIPDGGGMRAMSYAPVNNFYGHTQDDLQRSLDDRDRALKAEMPSMMDRHTFNQRRGMA